MTCSIANIPLTVAAKSVSAHSRKQKQVAVSGPRQRDGPKHAISFAGRPFSGTKLRATSGYNTRALRLFKAATIAEASVQDMNNEFHIEGSVKVAEGEGSLPKVVLNHENGGSAEMYLFGACVTSWVQAHGSEVLFVRPDAKFDGEKPISGGIPHCFPQFGPGAMQQHGFARNLNWRLVASSADNGHPSVTVELTENDYTRAMWDFSFKALYTVTLTESQLTCEFKAINTDDKPFDFDTALHTYIEVLDASNDQVCVMGLKGKSYKDKTVDPNDPPIVEETREAVQFGSSLVDSVYLNTDPIALLDVGTGCSVSIENAQGYSDTVVWNPHMTMEACWKNFVCVESAKVGEKVTLGPGEEWTGVLNLGVIDH